MRLAAPSLHYITVLHSALSKESEYICRSCGTLCCVVLIKKCHSSRKHAQHSLTKLTAVKDSDYTGGNCGTPLITPQDMLNGVDARVSQLPQTSLTKLTAVKRH